MPSIIFDVSLFLFCYYYETAMTDMGPGRGIRITLLLNFQQSMNARNKLLLCKFESFWSFETFYVGITTILVIIFDLYFYYRFNSGQVWKSLKRENALVRKNLHTTCKLLNNKTFWENLRNEKGESLAPSLPSRNKTPIMAAKNDVNVDTKVF